MEGRSEHSGPGSGAYACEVQANFTLKHGRGQDDQGYDHDRRAKLGAAFDAIKVAPLYEGKKRSKRLPSPVG